MTDRQDPTRIAIPPMGRELHMWYPSGVYLSRTQRAAQTGEYHSALPASISRCAFDIPMEVAADLEEAADALGRLDVYAAAKFGTKIRVLGPMSSILLRTESTSSSQIENLTVGAKNLALQSLGEGRGGNAAVVVGNVRAMESALGFAKDLNERQLLAMHAALLSVQEGYEQFAGRYRSELVWVGGASPRQARHVGPQPELVPQCMRDLLEFMCRDDMPVILQCAVAHAQFETIHPFIDGNGRVGRALVHAILRNKGLVNNATPPVSAGLLTDTEGYFQALQTYRDGNAGPIIMCFIHACQYAAGTGVALIDALDRQLDDARMRLRGVRRDSSVWNILPLLVEQPIINVDYLVHTAGLTYVTARRTIEMLTNRGVLIEIMGGRRNTVWEHRGILQVLDDYAAQLRRK